MNETWDSNLFLNFILFQRSYYFFSFDESYTYNYISVVLVASDGVFSNSFHIKKEKEELRGVTYKLDFHVHFFPTKELQYRLYVYIYIMHYRLQCRRTLTHRYTLKKYSLAVRRDSRAFSLFRWITAGNKNFTFMYSKILFH